MRIRRNILFIFFAVSLLGVNSAIAQFNIKIPKIKTEKPKTDQPPETATPSETSVGQTERGRGGYPKFSYAPATSTAKFMRSTVEISVKTEHLNEFSKFIPKIRFDSYYDRSSRLRYAAEWTKGDGSPWFTEQLETLGEGNEENHIVTFRSPYSDETFQAHATNLIGSFGVKVVDTKSGATIFTGKFKVGKLPMDPDGKKKDYNLFYVDDDWSLGIGYVGFDFDNWHEDQLLPTVSLWFKGNLDSKDLEARLFYNNQQVADTDDGGMVNSGYRRGEDCFLRRELCEYTLWRFNWNNFILESNDYGREKYPKAIFTRDKPGEYTVKIFHKGVQVREAKFTIDSRGFFAPNPVADQVPMVYGGTVVPVKVMGGLDKPNPPAVRNDAFYGNPLPGFPAQ